jgi:hypothetical protein
MAGHRRAAHRRPIARARRELRGLSPAVTSRRPARQQRVPAQRVQRQVGRRRERGSPSGVIGRLPRRIGRAASVSTRSWVRPNPTESDNAYGAPGPAARPCRRHRRPGSTPCAPGGSPPDGRALGQRGADHRQMISGGVGAGFCRSQLQTLPRCGPAISIAASARSASGASRSTVCETVRSEASGPNTGLAGRRHQRGGRHRPSTRARDIAAHSSGRARPTAVAVTRAGPIAQCRARSCGRSRSAAHTLLPTHP